jgi:hypothetical protein
MASRLSRPIAARLRAAFSVTVLVIGTLGPGRAPVQAESLAPAEQIEPGAGAWRTWVLESPQQIPVPPPPDTAETRAELEELAQLAVQRTAADLEQIRFWDAGSPGYRWNEMVIAQAAAAGPPRSRTQGALALLNVAIYDAMIATWDAKYTYQRLRPSDVDSALATVLATPRSPAYPAEHAVAAGAAAVVLAYLFPSQADAFQQQAEAAGRSRALAGVQYPSDVAAGLELGRSVGALVVDRARSDGSDTPWQGSIPTGPGIWNGTNPLVPQAASWRPWALESASQFRPGPPPGVDSQEMSKELAEVATYARTPATDQIAFFWQNPQTVGSEVVYWNEQTTRELSESRLDMNPPWAAQAYALQTVAVDDAFVACWDAKYTYWRIRPFQLDTAIKPLFPNPPNHPSYPSAHGCHSGAAAAVLGALFPSDAAELNRVAVQATESRLWAGIHFRSDLDAGLKLGQQVAQVVNQWPAAGTTEQDVVNAARP